MATPADFRLPRSEIVLEKNSDSFEQESQGFDDTGFVHASGDVSGGDK